jgi:hypothetical protein
MARGQHDVACVEEHLVDLALLDEDHVGDATDQADCHGARQVEHGDARHDDARAECDDDAVAVGGCDPHLQEFSGDRQRSQDAHRREPGIRPCGVQAHPRHHQGANDAHAHGKRTGEPGRLEGGRLRPAPGGRGPREERPRLGRRCDPFPGSGGRRAREGWRRTRQPDPVAHLGLGQAERLAGPADQVGRLLAVSRVGDHAYADRHFQRLAVEAVAVPLHCPAHPLGQVVGLRPVCAGQQAHELLAPEAGHQVTGPDAPRQHPRHFLDDVVACQVAILVVDVAQVVQIHQEQGGRPPHPAGPGKLLRQGLLKVAVVVQPGLGIHFDQMDQLHPAHQHVDDNQRPRQQGQKPRLGVPQGSYHRPENRHAHLRQHRILLERTRIHQANSVVQLQHQSDHQPLQQSKQHHRRRHRYQGGRSAKAAPARRIQQEPGRSGGQQRLGRGERPAVPDRRPAVADRVRQHHQQAVQGQQRLRQQDQRRKEKDVCHHVNGALPCGVDREQMRHRRHGGQHAEGHQVPQLQLQPRPELPDQNGCCDRKESHHVTERRWLVIPHAESPPSQTSPAIAPRRSIPGDSRFHHSH